MKQWRSRSRSSGIISLAAFTWSAIIDLILKDNILQFTAFSCLKTLIFSFNEASVCAAVPVRQYVNDMCYDWLSSYQGGSRC